MFRPARLENGHMATPRMSGRLAVAVLAACMVAGCTAYNPQSHFEVSKVKAEFEGKNFVVSKVGVQGSASAPFLFGSGQGPCALGIMLADDDIQRRAMTDLVSQADLKGKPAFFHNVNTEWTTVGIPFLYVDHRLTVTADVVEFTDEYVDYKSRN